MSDTKKIKITVGEFKKLIREASEEMAGDGQFSQNPMRPRGDTTNSELQSVIEKSTSDILSKVRAFMNSKGVNPNQRGFDELSLELQRKIGQAVFGYFMSHKNEMGDLGIKKQDVMPYETNDAGEIIASRLEDGLDSVFH